MEVINFHHPTPPTSCCVVCGTSSLSSNYVDLTLVSSRTSQSDTPVRDKVRTIIGEEKWMMPQQQQRGVGDHLTMVMCHQCFHLVDQFDTLEAQLHSVKAQLCDKYFAFHGSPPVVVDHQVPYQRLDHHRGVQHGHNGGGSQQRVKRGTVAPTAKSRAQGNISLGKRKRGGTVLETREQNLSLQTTAHGVCLQVDNRKDKTETILQWHNTVLHPFEQTAGPGLPELAVPSQQLTDRETEHIITSLNNAVADSAWRPPAQQSPCLQQQQRQTVHHHDPVSDDEAQDSAQRPAEEVVYDHLPGLLVPGERLRVGTLLLEDGGPSYRCCYCGDLFAERIVLSSHVHSHHRPEVLTAQVPAELGLGSKLNCGVQLSNVVTAASSEFAKPFACIFCDSAFKFKSNVHLHFKEKHTPYKPFSCMDCSETFRRSMELSRHRVYYCSFRKKARAGGDKKSK